MFAQSQAFDSESADRAFSLAVDLQSVAQQLGVDTPFDAIGLADMSADQLQAVHENIAAAIEAAYHEHSEALRKMRRCPAGYLWDREGDGWRCQGGTHYCDAQQIKEFMDTDR